MKKCWLYFAAVLLLLGAATACEKKSTGGGGNEPAPQPAKVHDILLEMLQEQADAYGKSEETPLKHVYICSHRAITVASVQKGLPENSLPNIQEAIDQGADMVELDVRTTKDGVPMLMHDESVSATTDGSGSISGKTFEQMKALKMHPRGKTTYPTVDGEYVRVPTLVEALELCKGKIYVNLDVKDCSMDRLLQAIQEADAFDDVMIYGYTVTQKKECIEWAYNNAHTWLAVHPYISNPDDCKQYLVQSFYGCAKLFQYSEDVYYNNTTPLFGYKCHAHGALSYSNSLTRDSEISTWYETYYKEGIEEGPCKVLERFIAAGSDFVQTNMLEYADLYFKEKGLR